VPSVQCRLVHRTPCAVRLTAGRAIGFFFITVDIDVGLILAAIEPVARLIGPHRRHLILTAIAFPIDRLIGRRVFEHLPVASLITQIDRAAQCAAEQRADNRAADCCAIAAVARTDEATGHTTENGAYNIAVATNRSVVGRTVAAIAIGRNDIGRTIDRDIAHAAIVKPRTRATIIGPAITRLINVVARTPMIPFTTA
jgi:hypothetical protein